nr:MAG TPA: tail tape measure protein [Caudoviricetes sp.]
MQPIKLEIFLDDRTLAGMKSAEGNIAALESFNRQMVERLQGELKQLERQYRQLQKQGLAGDRELADIQALKGVIGGLKDEIKAYEAAKRQAGETPLVAHDPAPKLNQVRMTMAQIARELPSLAMGPQMFFLAISNNIPMFTDAVSNARKDYELMTAAGKKATPVWKQVAASLFSPQTALAALITLTVVYRKEIGEWIKGLFGGKNAMDELRESMRETYEVEKEANATFVKSRFEMDRVIKSVKEFKGSKEEERKKVTELNRTYGETFGYYQTLSEWYDTLMKKSSDYIEILVLEQKARKWLDKAVEESDKADKLKAEGVEAHRPWFGAGGKIHKFFGGGSTDQFGSDPALVAYNRKLKGIYDAEEDALKRAEEFQDKAARIKEGTNINTVVSGSVEELESSIAEKRKALKKLTNKEDYEAAMKVIEAEEKKLETITGKKNKDGGRNASDYQDALSDARLRAQRKLEDARIALMAEGSAKRKALLRQEYEQTLAAIDKEERELLSRLEKSKKAGNPVAPGEADRIRQDASSQRVVAGVQYMQDVYDEEKQFREKDRQAWIDYNREYGSYQEKRLAITQDYALKIAAAETEGEKAMLKRRREDELKELDFGEFKKTVNLADVFGNLDAQSTEALSALRDKLKEYISGAAKELRPSDLKQLQDALTNIDLKLADRKPFRELKRSMDEYANAQGTVQKAQEDLNTVMAGGKVITGLYRDETGKLVTGLLTQEQAEKKLTEAQENRRRKRTAMAQSLQGVAGEMSSYGQAADDVVSMLEGFGVSVDENAKRVIEGFNTMSEGIGQFANSMLSGDIGGMISGVVNTAGGFVKTLGSLFGTDWGGQRSERRYQQAKERYESYMAVLDKVIAKQKELVASMETDTLANANNSYKKAGELLQQQEEYAREMGKAYLNAGASKGFLGIGSKASHGTKQREGISSTAWEQARRVLGSDFSKVADGRMTGLFDLSYEKLVELRDEATGFWSELHEDTRKYLEQIIESEEAWQEVQETRKEAMTGISFESVRSSFLDMLMDMDSSTADFADNFEKYMQRAMLNSMLSESYNERLRKWYDSFAEAMEEKTEWRTGQGRRGRNRYKVTTEAAGVLSQTEYDALKESWDSIVSDALAERDAMKEIFGWQGDPASSQSGRNGAFTTMTQEQGTLLEGLFTSLQDHASGMHKLLEELAKSRKEDHDLLVSIAENTAYCRYLESINEIMEYFRNNGIEVS